MKRIVLVIAFAAILGTGTAFADHPSGFGIGVVGNLWLGDKLVGVGGGGLSLKFPGGPIFWAINFGGGGGHYEGNFGFGLTGDYYIIDKSIAPTLHWFFGIGGFLNFYTWWNSYHNRYYDRRDEWSWSHINFGIRLPIGLSWQPIKFLELWIDLAPSFGLGIDTDSNHTYRYDGRDYGHEFWVGTHWGFPVEVGLRFWF
jgi:hypothetical protein